MYNYVQVVSGVIVGLQQSTVEVSAPGLFEVETYDPGLVGRLWVDGAPGDLAPVTEPVADAVFLAQKAAAIAALPNSIKFLSAEERGVAASLFAEWQAGMDCRGVLPLGWCAV